MDELVMVKVDGKNRVIHRDLLALLEAKDAHVSKMEREVEGYKLILGKVQAGQPVSVTGEQSMMFAAERMKAEWDAEVRSGMTGWIQHNWGKLCKIQCDCGDFVSYEVLRSRHELKCNKCSGGNSDPA